jgi:uncharacterized protein YqgC (DUF456 family)
VVVTVQCERRQEVCADCGEGIGLLFLALPSLGIFLHPRCGALVGRRLQEEAEEALLLSARGSCSRGHRP